MKRKLSMYERLPTFSTNEYHPLNPFHADPPDFIALARKYPASFGVFTHITSSSGVCHIDFTNPEAQYALTQTLLLDRFSIRIMDYLAAKQAINQTASDDVYQRLIPPIPNRINYLCWMSELLNLIGRGDVYNDDRDVHVLDIGVGAFCIYPLIGHKLFNWRFTGSDIDERSLYSAKMNIQLNPWIPEHSIRLVKTEESSNIQSLLSCKLSRWLESSIRNPSPVSEILKACDIKNHRGPIRQSMIDMGINYEQHVLKMEDIYSTNDIYSSTKVPILSACMTNPPFYDTDEEIGKLNSHICTGNDVEMRTRGGELAFLGAMIADSLILRDTIALYTCMVGKKSTMVLLLAILRAEGFQTITSTRFTQGRTMRWGVGWSSTAFPNINDAESKRSSKNQTKMYPEIGKFEVVMTDKEIVDTMDVNESSCDKTSSEVLVARFINSLEDSADILLRQSDIQLDIRSCDVDDGNDCDEMIVTCVLQLTRVTESETEPLKNLNLKITINITRVRDSSKVNVAYARLDSTEENITEFVKHVTHIMDMAKLDIIRQNRRWRRRLQVKTENKRPIANDFSNA